MERLFLQLIKKKLSNLDKFPLNDLPQNTEFCPAPFLFPTLKFQKKISPHSHVLFEILVLPFYKGGWGGGEETMH